MILPTDCFMSEDLVGFVGVSLSAGSGVLGLKAIWFDEDVAVSWGGRSVLKLVCKVSLSKLPVSDVVLARVDWSVLVFTEID